MDDSVIVISDDDEEGNVAIKPDVKMVCHSGNEPSCSDVWQNDMISEIQQCTSTPKERQPDEEQIVSTTKSLNKDFWNHALLPEHTAVLDLDDSLVVPERKPEKEFDESPENPDFLIDYGQQSFSQPVQSSSSREIPLATGETVKLPPSPVTKIRTSMSIRRSISDGAFTNKKKRKRTKEEIEAEQAAKEETRQRKQQERMEKKKRMELTKQIAKFERDIIAAKKSKCEQNLFCVINLDLLATIENLDRLLKQVFEERNIGDQLLYDGTGMSVCWKRKILEGEIENGEFIRGEKLMNEQFCILSMNAQRYSEFKSAEEIAEFVGRILQKYPIPSPRVTVVVYGLLKLRKERVADFVFELFERYRAQTRFILTVEEYALFIAQMHRSIARNERHLEEQNQPIVVVEKGITEGDNSSIVSDWWMKMLNQMHRMGSDAKRSIVTTFPNPHYLLKLLKKMSMKDGMKLLADTKMDNDRRIGPVLARKIYLTLTSINGTEIVDEN